MMDLSYITSRCDLALANSYTNIIPPGVKQKEQPS